MEPETETEQNMAWAWLEAAESYAKYIAQEVENVSQGLCDYGKRSGTYQDKDMMRPVRVTVIIEHAAPEGSRNE